MDKVEENAFLDFQSQFQRIRGSGFPESNSVDNIHVDTRYRDKIIETARKIYPQYYFTPKEETRILVTSYRYE